MADESVTPEETASESVTPAASAAPGAETAGDAAGSSSAATAANPVLTLGSDGGDGAGESVTPSDDADERPARPLGEPAKPDRGGFVWGTGRRKTAVARVRIKPGSGKFAIKSTTRREDDVETFFSEPQHRHACVAPLEATGTLDKLDVHVNVRGGGRTGQAEAILLGVARALKGYDPTLEQTLRDHHFLTRDAREVERKKYGQRGARRRFQFSKR